MKILTGIFWVLSKVIFVALLVSLLVAAPLIAGYKPIVVVSDSMVPDYPVGSITYYKETAADEIGEDDTITFKTGESSIATHRVVEKDEENECFITKGDNNTTQDSLPVPYDDVVGKTMDFAVPYVGYAAQYLSGNWVLIGALAVILLIDMMLPARKKKVKLVVDVVSGEGAAYGNAANYGKADRRGNKKNGKIDIRAMANIQPLDRSAGQSSTLPRRTQGAAESREKPAAVSRPLPRGWK